MQRTQPTRLTSSRKHRQKLIGKELDLLILAGCSCLLTLLYHPVAEALQTNPSSTTAQSAIATRLSKMPVNVGGMIYLALPPEQEGIQEEDE